jgi:hypothetical protein
MVDGARTAMTGASLNRVLEGIAHRYDEVSPDPAGTKALTVVALMKAAGLAIQAASAYLQLKFGITVGTDPAGSGSNSAPPAPNDHTADVNVLAAVMKAPRGALAGIGSLASAGASGAPSALPPAQLEEGNLAHELIGDTYCALNPPSVFDLSVADVLSFAKGRLPGLAEAIKAAQADLFTNLDMRPDIVDLGKMQIFEIKPAGSIPLAIAEAALYIQLFDGLGIPALSFTPGNPGNPGTRGMIPGPDSVLVWASPAPGAIGYAFVRRPDSPQRVQERIESGAYEPGLGLGPEAMIGLSAGLGAAAALGVAELSPLAVASYETLLPILVKAVQAAGQAIPALVQAAQ